MTEYLEIIRELKKGRGLTCIEAIRKGISINLRSRIPELREKGYWIYTTMEYGGVGSKRRIHARYFLIQGAQ